MADDPKDKCKNCGHPRKDHMTDAKNRSNVKMSRTRGGKTKSDKYDFSFRHCPGFNPENGS